MYTHTYTYIQTCIHMHVQTYVQTYIHMHMQTGRMIMEDYNIGTCTHMHRVNACTCTALHTHKHMHTQTGRMIMEDCNISGAAGSGACITLGSEAVFRRSVLCRYCMF